VDVGLCSKLNVSYRCRRINGGKGAKRAYIYAICMPVYLRRRTWRKRRIFWSYTAVIIAKCYLIISLVIRRYYLIHIIIVITYYIGIDYNIIIVNIIQHNSVVNTIIHIITRTYINIVCPLLTESMTLQSTTPPPRYRRTNASRATSRSSCTYVYYMIIVPSVTTNN